MTSTATLVEAAPEPLARHRASHRRPVWPIAVPGLIAGVFGAYWLTRPFQLTGVHGTTASGHGYDDAVYLGAAIRLIHGELPYRDFLLLHPPGISVLFAPIAFLSDYTGTPVGLAIARILGVVVAVANVMLVAYLVRYRGSAASLTAGLIFALFPLAISATHTLSLIHI